MGVDERTRLGLEWRRLAAERERLYQLRRNHGTDSKPWVALMKRDTAVGSRLFGIGEQLRALGCDPLLDPIPMIVTRRRRRA